MAFGDFIYYTLLKHGTIIIVVLGIILVIMVVTYAQKFGIGMERTASSALIHCKENIDCFEHCGKCVSFASSKICEPNFEIKCVCINNNCQAVQTLQD